MVIFWSGNLFYKVLTPAFESVSLLSEASAFGELHIINYILKILERR